MHSVRVAVHDYPGHAFPVQLSRKLAARNHEVLHLHSHSVISPRGAIAKSATDAPSFRISGIDLGRVIEREAFVRRYFQERAYGRLLRKQILDFKPELVISATTPLDAQTAALDAASAMGGAFVFWLQDLQGIAIERLLGAKLGLPGRLIGRYYKRMEQRLLRESDAVVTISEDFTKVLHNWGVDSKAIWTIPNWASPQEVPERSKDNSWSRAHGISGRFCFLYSGTLGMKHNPNLLLQLAWHYRGNTDVRVVVVSEGVAAQWLTAKAVERGLGNLIVLPFQPYSTFPDVLASADVLLTILEPDAGVFSVPSKVLSYLCAARPLLLAVPGENLATRTVLESGAGVAVEPDDPQAFIREAEMLRTNPDRRSDMSARARQYADRNFDLERIADRFEEVFEAALRKRTR